MITQITIGDKRFYQIGEKLRVGKKETDITVEKIRIRFGKVKVYLSNKEVLVFKGYPYIAS